MHSLTIFVQVIDFVVLLDGRLIILLKTELVFWPRPLLVRWVRFRATVFAMDRGWYIWGVWSCGVIDAGWRWKVCILSHCRLGDYTHFQRSFYTVTFAVTEGFMVRAPLPPITCSTASMATVIYGERRSLLINSWISAPGSVLIFHVYKGIVHRPSLSFPHA